MKKNYTKNELAAMNSAEFQSIFRQGDWAESVVNVFTDYAKLNLSDVPWDMAFEFLLFAHRNPKACAVTDVTKPGDPHPKLLAPESDLRTRYRVYKDGKLIDEPTDVIKYWWDNLVAFLIGGIPNVFSSLDKANVRYRLIGDFTSIVPAVPARRFYCSLIVSGTLVKTRYDAVQAVQISSRLPDGHGTPVHIGNPDIIGINDLYQTDIFSLGPISPQEFAGVAMFCGYWVIPQLAVTKTNVPFVITYKPAFFLSERPVEKLAIFSCTSRRGFSSKYNDNELCNSISGQR